MATDSVMQLVRYQNSIGAAPPVGSFSVRQNWGSSLSKLGNSLRTYVARYKGVTTYIKLNGAQNATTVIAGVLADILNGAQADKPPLSIVPLVLQSKFWTVFESAIVTAYNNANSKGATMAMDWFKVSSPASNVASLRDAVNVVKTLLEELANSNSVSAGGQFRLDLQNTVPINPFGLFDPRPVFNWLITISFDHNNCTITLTADIKYDHMESENALGDLILATLGVITGGLFLGAGAALFGGAGGLVVGEVYSREVNSTANSALLNAFGGPFSPLTWLGQPIELTFSGPTQGELEISVALRLDETTCREIEDLLNNEPLLLALLDLFFPSGG